MGNSINSIINRKVKQFEVDLSDVLNDVAIDFTDIVREHVKDDIYSVESSYDRSLNMISSVRGDVKKITNGYVVEAYNDPDLMTDLHESWVTNEDMRRAIPYFMENGNNSSLYSYEGRHYIENSQKEVNQYTKKLKRKLKSKGYTVK